MPPSSRLTSNDLPSDLMREHRVMFVRSSSLEEMTVTTDTMRAGLDAILSAALHKKVKVISLADAPPDAVAAYPSIMVMTADTKVAVRDALSTPRSEGSKTSRSRKKPREPKPE